MKHKTPRSKEYLDFIRSQACIVGGHITNDYSSVVAHHVRLNSHAGCGLKPSDYRTIPIAQVYHQELHDIGEAKFYRERNINVEKWITHYMGTWAIMQGSGQEAINALESVILNNEDGI